MKSIRHRDGSACDCPSPADLMADMDDHLRARGVDPARYPYGRQPEAVYAYLRNRRPAPAPVRRSPAVWAA